MVEENVAIHGFGLWLEAGGFVNITGTILPINIFFSASICRLYPKCSQIVS